MKVIETEHPKEDAGKALTKSLVGAFTESIRPPGERSSERPILLMVSGGSALSILDFVETKVLGPHVTLTVLDERFSVDPAINNFAQLEQTEFYARCISKGVKTISTKLLGGESFSGLRDQFDTALHDWKAQNPEGLIVATMGIGSDGHTAGIFPGKYEVDFDGDSWVVGYRVPKEVNPYTDRITVTYTFLLSQVNEAVVYAVGAEKQKIVQKIKRGKIKRGIEQKIKLDDCSGLKIPARVFHQMSEVKMFVPS